VRGRKARHIEISVVNTVTLIDGNTKVRDWRYKSKSLGVKLIITAE